MLAAIKFRGAAPRAVDRWRYIYTAIRTSESIDEWSAKEHGITSTDDLVKTDQPVHDRHDLFPTV
jgi:hypothetical protein